MVQPNNQRQVYREKKHAHLLQPGHDAVLMETVPAGQLHHLAARLVLFAAHLRQLNLAFSRSSMASCVSNTGEGCGAWLDGSADSMRQHGSTITAVPGANHCAQTHRAFVPRLACSVR